MACHRPNLDACTRDSGFALAAVLWIILAVAAILTPLSINARTQAIHIAALQQTDRLNTLAKGIATVLISQYRDTLIQQTTNGMSANSTSKSCRSGVLLLSFQLQNHAGLVNVNTASQGQLAQVFGTLGQSSSQSENLADNVIAHRSYSSITRSVSERGIRGGPKHAPLESLAELYDIQGTQLIAYRDLRETLTVRTNSNTLAAQAMPERLQRLSNDGDVMQAVKWDNSALMTSPVTVSVVVQRGRHNGQFHGIYATLTTRNVLDHIVETWRFDSPELQPTSGSEPDCSQQFGADFHQALEAFG